MIRSDYTRAWLPDKEKGWVPVLFIKELNEGNTCLIKRIVDGGTLDQEGEVEEVDLRLFGEKELGGWDICDGLPLMNEDTGPEGVHDMVNMGKLHEPGRIVIAVNPYRWLPELYEQKTQATYVNAVEAAVRDSLAPHVYSVSAAAMAELKKGKGQSILVSGESGAGKTETVKILISHIAFISSEMEEEEMLQEEEVAGNDQAVRIREDAASIITKIVNLNPLLEAFGNAKTVRNDNSSRFGKFTRLQMVVDDSNSASRMIGSRSSTYLLEKSRVVFHEPGERSFHIFYQLLAGAPVHVRDACLLSNLTASNFVYLMAERGNDEREMSGIIDGKSDAERFDMTCKALDLAGLSASEQLELFRGIAGCLFVGLLSFDASGDDEESSIVSCKHSLEPVVNTLGLTSSKDLEDTLTIRQVKARGEIVFTPNRPSASENARDAMAKALYATLFAWLVSRINRSTTATSEDRVQRSQNHRCGGDILSCDGNEDGSPTDVNLLDIFGFESFKTNFFEQLLINYANEKLQQRFTLDVFRTQQQEYEVEGVPWSHIDYSDNSEVLWLIESPSGVIGLLNEECVVPRGADRRLASKLNSIHDEHVAFVAAKPGHATEESFGIRHYAATVVYTAKGMLEKNKDAVSESIIEILQRSNLGVIREAFSLPNLNEGGGGTGSLSLLSRHRRTQTSITNSGSRSLASTFKNSLTNLMEAVDQTQVQYIRCIKPNEAKSSGILEPLKVISQLRCAGVIEAIRISRAAYTNRLAYDVFQSRFRMLAPGLLNKEDKYCSGSLLLEHLLPQREGGSASVYELGRTKVFFRAGALESLERRRRNLLCLEAIRLQAFYRMRIAQVHLCRAMEGVRLIQAFTRGWQARLRFYMTMRRIVQIQCFFRMNRAIQVTQQLREFRAATKIEALCRGRPMRIRFMLWRQSATTIQAWARGCLAVRHFTVAIHEHHEAQKLENQVAALQARLAAEEEARLQLQSQLELSKAVESRSLPEEKTIMNTQFQYSNSSLSNEEFDAMLHESGVIIVALKSEVMKLREQNEALKDENDDLKRDRQHLMCDTTKFSNTAATHSVKRLTKANSAPIDELVEVKEHCKKLQRQNHDRAEEVIALKQIYDNEVILRKTQCTLIEDIAMTLSAAETPIDDCGKGELVHYVNKLYRECMMAASHMHSSTGEYPVKGAGASNVDKIINSVTSNVMGGFNFIKRTMKDSD